MGFSTRLRPTARGERRGQETIDRRTRREVRRLVADDPAEVRARRREIRFGSQGLRLAGRQLRFGLRNVRARHFADIEAIAGLLERLFEHAHVAALNFERRRIAQIVHVDRGSLQQDRLLEHAQRLAGSRDLALRRARPVGGLIAVVERLVDGQAGAARPLKRRDSCGPGRRAALCWIS